MTPKKFTEFINQNQGKFQYDAETIALHRACTGYPFKYVDPLKAATKAAELIRAFSHPVTQDDIDDVYTDAQNNGPSTTHFVDIVADWEHYESRFLALLKRNEQSAMDIGAYMGKAADLSREVKVLCCYIKVECDAARPWQYKPNISGIDETYIVDRWNKKMHESVLCELPLHASYPSGHACVAYMHAALIRREYPAEAQLIAEAFTTAKRISERRILAGLHFKRDIDAAKALIDAAIP